MRHVHFLITAVVGAAALAACSVETRDPAPGAERAAAVSEALTDTLGEYATKCNAAIPVAVPDFDCDDPNATEVPDTHPGPGDTCDRPNQLSQVCDPGSRFHVLANTSAAIVVAHCRKKHMGAGRYGDIAVIQYNKSTGDTCFYQALGNLPAKVNAPGTTGDFPWLSPASTASIGCAGCHDNGPLIRSPYLAQIPASSPNHLPGAGDPAFNRDQPYRFVGNDFAAWRTYRVEIPGGNLCTSCHRLGVNNVSSFGTARDFALRSVGAKIVNGAAVQLTDAELAAVHKNPNSANSPLWMPLDHPATYNPSNADQARIVHDCAMQFQVGQPLPDTSTCRIVPFAEQDPPPPWNQYQVLEVSPQEAGPGDTVTIHGKNFRGNMFSGNRVFFGASEGTNVHCGVGPNGADCTVTVPAGAGTVDVQVEVQGLRSQVTPADRFRYGALTITSISPATGHVSGGTYVLIRGTGMDASAGPTGQMRVLFGNVEVPPVTCSDSTYCLVYSPAVPTAGAVDVRVRSFGVTSPAVPADVFTYFAEARLASVTVANAAGGHVLDATLTLDGIAPAGGAVVSLASSDPTFMNPPATITIPAGAGSIRFSPGLHDTLPGTATLTATYGGTSVSTVVHQFCAPQRCYGHGVWDGTVCACVPSDVGDCGTHRCF